METHNKLCVGLTYNLKTDTKTPNEDDQAEFDDWETVNKIRDALEHAGCNVVLMEATGSIINCLQSNNIDIVFNFAEGLKGRGRESQVPSLLNLLSIPFTGSDETTLAVALDKALAKKVVSYEKVKTAAFQVFFSTRDKIRKGLKFPLIVKPNAEGSSKGIIDTSIAHCEEELYYLVSRIIKNYNQPTLVEEYIDGREFTVGILGNGDDLEMLPIMEIDFENSPVHKFYSYRIKKQSIDLLSYTCPAILTADEEKAISRMARRVYTALQCNDVARIDLRLSNVDNKPYFIEINPLPGLVDGYSDLTLICRASGMSYDQLIVRILNEALKRYGMPTI